MSPDMTLLPTETPLSSHPESPSQVPGAEQGPSSVLSGKLGRVQLQTLLQKAGGFLPPGWGFLSRPASRVALTRALSAFPCLLHTYPSSRKPRIQADI